MEIKEPMVNNIAPATSTMAVSGCFSGAWFGRGVEMSFISKFRRRVFLTPFHDDYRRSLGQIIKSSSHHQRCNIPNPDPFSCQAA